MNDADDVCCFKTKKRVYDAEDDDLIDLTKTKKATVKHKEEGEEEGEYGKYNFKRLKRVVLAHSKSQKWKKAVLEWELESVYDEKGGTCICGHRPITEHCIIRNDKTDRALVVGNVCIKKFGRDTLTSTCERVVSCIGRWRKKHIEDWRANEELLALFMDGGLLNQWEYDFYSDVHRKRNVTSRQQDKLWKINNKMDIALENLPRICTECRHVAYARKSFSTGKIYWLCKNNHPTWK